MNKFKKLEKLFNHIKDPVFIIEFISLISYSGKDPDNRIKNWLLSSGAMANMRFTIGAVISIVLCFMCLVWIFINANFIENPFGYKFLIYGFVIPFACVNIWVLFADDFRLNRTVKNVKDILIEVSPVQFAHFFENYMHVRMMKKQEAIPSYEILMYLNNYIFRTLDIYHEDMHIIAKEQFFVDSFAILRKKIHRRMDDVLVQKQFCYLVENILKLNEAKDRRKVFGTLLITNQDFLYVYRIIEPRLPKEISQGYKAGGLIK